MLKSLKKLFFVLILSNKNTQKKPLVLHNSKKQNYQLKNKLFFRQSLAFF